MHYSACFCTFKTTDSSIKVSLFNVNAFNKSNKCSIKCIANCYVFKCYLIKKTNVHSSCKVGSMKYDQLQLF